ncbi:hypothetical protein WR25_19473 isoform A [Diploscapter pachys]|uniref:Ground-like domain-containing protein n=2 Tax=Diploscapter pachys TaxID=2018661 RepID=A0A2A2K0L4_9BILA|nr:hypothetical protein WR25_19473 isoform A [Diploscapter pachys]
MGGGGGGCCCQQQPIMMSCPPPPPPCMMPIPMMSGGCGGGCGGGHGGGCGRKKRSLRAIGGPKVPKVEINNAVCANPKVGAIMKAKLNNEVLGQNIIDYRIHSEIKKSVEGDWIVTCVQQPLTISGLVKDYCISTRDDLICYAIKISS